MVNEKWSLLSDNLVCCERWAVMSLSAIRGHKREDKGSAAVWVRWAGQPYRVKCCVYKYVHFF